MKKFISKILAAGLVLSTCNMPVFAAADYTIEAENYSSTNWKYIGGSMINNNSNASGGKYLTLKMDTDSDTEFYAEYIVNVTTAGYYKLTLNSTPVSRTGWSSPLYISVNGGNKILLSGTRSDSTVVSGTGLYACDSDVIYLNAGENTIKFIVKDKNDDGKYVSSIDNFSLTASSFAIDGVYSDNPFMVFESGKAANIYVKGNGITNSEVSVSYTVKTYNGTSVTSGTAAIPAGEKMGNIALTGLAKGTYTISATYSGKTVSNYFSVVAPKSERTVYDDTAFALDTNMISLYNKYTDSKDFVVNYAKALDLMGISYIRDRISMDSVVTKSGGVVTANTQAHNYIGKAIKEHSNIKISATINDLPSWMVGSDGALDCELIDVYEAFKALGDALGDSVDAIEILNEVDAGGGAGGTDAPNIYAALFKAAAAGINDSKCHAVVISQGASALKAIDYIDVLYKNEVFSISSADNYHFHSNYKAGDTRTYVQFPGISALAEIKAMQKRNAEEKPIWITEAGLLIECASDTELSAAQQYAQAKYVITSAAESIASGADKNFYFVGTEYQEDENTTGIMSKNDTYPSFYAAYAAMAAMTDILGKGEYAGNLNSGDMRAYVFKDGSKQIIVAYSVSGTQTLNISGSYKKFDMFGNLLSGTSGSISLTEEPIFIVSDGTVSGTNTTGAHSIEAVIPGVMKTGDRIVLSQEYSKAASMDARSGSYVIGANNNTVTVTVANLNNEAFSGTIVPDTDVDWTFQPETQEFSLGAFETGTYTFTINDYANSHEAIVTFKAVADGSYSMVTAAKVKSGSDEYLNSASRYWIDATKYSRKTGAYVTKQYASAVNGSLMELNTTGYDTKLIESTLSYDFSIADRGTYDIWILASDPNVNHMTRWKWRYDNNSYKNYTYGWFGPDEVYTAGGQAMYWYNVGENVNLSAGKHSIDILSDALRGGNYNDYMLQRLDSIVIVPTSDSWWNPDGKTNGANVTAFENRNFASNFNFAQLTENVVLPSSTQTGADVDWTSSDTSVIENDGTIHRGLESKSATLTAKITYGTSSTTVSIPVTVEAIEDLLPIVTLVDEYDNVITEFNRNRDNFVKVSATNPLSETKSAFLHIGGYDSETNELRYFKTTEINIESGKTTTPEKILIDDEDGIGLYKVFTWNSELKPLTGVAMLSTTMIATETRNDAIVTISGNCEKPDEKLTFTVTKEGSENLSSMSKDEVKKTLCYFGETTTDSSGNYNIKFKLEDANGKYKVNIKYSSGNKQSLFMVE